MNISNHKIKSTDGVNIMSEINLHEVTPDLFLEVAKRKALKLCDKKYETSTTQMRKFYNEVCKFEDIINSCKKDKQEEQLKKILPALCMLVPKAVYAKTRKNVNECFVEMIRDCVTQVKTSDDLRNFRLFFEAVIAYSKK